jgi:hypothetical protein
LLRLSVMARLGLASIAGLLLWAGIAWALT